MIDPYDKKLKSTQGAPLPPGVFAGSVYEVPSNENERRWAQRERDFKENATVSKAGRGGGGAKARRRKAPSKQGPGRPRLPEDERGEDREIYLSLNAWQLLYALRERGMKNPARQLLETMLPSIVSGAISLDDLRAFILARQSETLGKKVVA